MLKGFCFALSIFLGLALGAEAQEQDKLKDKDIHQIMDQIFSEHVNKKSMTTEIMQHALLIYIDQFDPHRMYLLKNELVPYVDLPPAELNQAIDQYKQNHFALFKKLNALIQNSILRSRKIRGRIRTEVKNSQFHPSPDKENNGANEGGLESFPATMEQLKEKVLKNLSTYIEVQNDRMGGALTPKKKEEILNSYEASLRDFEDQYLYQDENGNPLPAAEQENLFSIHVLKALASSLDAHTSFYQTNEAYDIRVRLQKEFRGIGLVLKDAPNGVIVTHMLEGGPAEKSKLINIGDILIEVDGESVVGHPFEKIMELLHGEKNTSMKLTFKRAGEKGKPDQVYTVELKRELIILNNDRVDVTSQPFGNGIIGEITYIPFIREMGYQVKWMSAKPLKR